MGEGSGEHSPAGGLQFDDLFTTSERDEALVSAELVAPGFDAISGPSASLGLQDVLLALQAMIRRHPAAEELDPRTREVLAATTLPEGLADAVLGETDLGAWFREHVEAAAVPLMDHDGVEDGDQGKNRHPHDHNRDYQGESLYPSVAALKRFVPRWSDGKLRIALDLHCPWIRGGNNEQIFFVGNRSPEMWKRQQHFSRLLQQAQTGPLVHDPRHDIPWGESWNTNRLNNTCSAWMAQQPGVSVSSTLEIPYATAANKPVTPATARQLGHDLAAAIRRYLELA